MSEAQAEDCDRMLELGVIIQPTGDHMNILKTKPPLCIDIESADFFVDTLDRVPAKRVVARTLYRIFETHAALLKGRKTEAA